MKADNATEVTSRLDLQMDVDVYSASPGAATTIHSCSAVVRI
jgi:hypothetical protein